MNEVPDPPPNTRLVRFAQRGEPFPAEAALLELLDLDVSEKLFQDLRTLSVLAGSEDSHFGFVFSKCSHHLCAYLSELQLLAYATTVVSLLTHTSSPSRVAPFSLSSKPALLSLQLSTLVQPVTPSNSFSLPSFDLMLSTFAVHSCIFSCPN
jgi:hypothetical protein